MRKQRRVLGTIDRILKIRKIDWENFYPSVLTTDKLCQGAIVIVVACKARGPGFDSSSDQMVFSLLGYRGFKGSRHDKLRDLAYQGG